MLEEERFEGNRAHPEGARLIAVAGALWPVIAHTLYIVGNNDAQDEIVASGL